MLFISEVFVDDAKIGGLPLKKERFYDSSSLRNVLTIDLNGRLSL